MERRIDSGSMRIQQIEVLSMKLLRWMCFLSAISSAGSGFLQAQTVADAARQERERRKEVESEISERIPVVTNGTSSPTAGSTAKTRVKTATAYEKSKSTGPTDSQGHDEKYWRAKFDAARLALKRAEDKLRVQDLKVPNGNSLLVPTRTTTALQRATYDRDAARKAVADAHQKIADLEDQLRRSGGLPGWSRPR
jgi:hypothetical protein